MVLVYVNVSGLVVFCEVVGITHYVYDACLLSTGMLWECSSDYQAIELEI